VVLYGVGAGGVDSEGDGDGASVEPRVFGGFLLIELFFFDGVGDAMVVAGAVVAVSCFCVQEAINAMPIRTVISDKIYFFIYSLASSAAGCLVAFELG